MINLYYCCPTTTGKDIRKWWKVGTENGVFKVSRQFDTFHIAASLCYSGCGGSISLRTDMEQAEVGGYSLFTDADVTWYFC